jgi:hypothetical protein
MRRLMLILCQSQHAACYEWSPAAFKTCASLCTTVDMSSMDVDLDLTAFLQLVRLEAPESLQGRILVMEDLWERRLWHQLTLEVEKLFVDPQSVGIRMRLFVKFVGLFEKNINELKLVVLALLAKEECNGLKPSHSSELMACRHSRSLDISHENCGESG